MLIEEVIKAIHSFRREAIAKANDLYNPTFIIYMDDQFWDQCMFEIPGGGYTNPIIPEFYNEGTMFGYPVFRVIPTRVVRENFKRHSPYRIFEVK